MNYLYLVIALALVQYLVFALQVGGARGKYDVQAPAVTGHEVFERFYRVQMNPLELLVILVPSLWVAAQYWPAHYMAAVGGVYLVGRVLYARSYVADPGSREIGFLLSILPIFVLLIASRGGIVMALIA